MKRIDRSTRDAIRPVFEVEMEEVTERLPKPPARDIHDAFDVGDVETQVAPPPFKRWLGVGNWRH